MGGADCEIFYVRQAVKLPAIKRSVFVAPVPSIDLSSSSATPQQASYIKTRNELSFTSAADSNFLSSC